MEREREKVRESGVSQRSSDSPCGFATNENICISEADGVRDREREKPKGTAALRGENNETEREVPKKSS